jgi:hypothetical protein
MEKAWAIALVIQHWLWVALKYLLGTGFVVCLLAVFVGILVGNYFNAKEKRKSAGR